MVDFPSDLVFSLSSYYAFKKEMRERLAFSLIVLLLMVLLLLSERGAFLF